MAWTPNQWTLARGEDFKGLVHVLDNDGEPLNCAGMTGICMMVKLSDGAILERIADVGFTYGSYRPIYIYGFHFTPEETANFKEGLGQTVQMKLTYNTISTSFNLAKALNVATPKL